MQDAIAAFNHAVESFTDSSRALTVTAETLLAEQQSARERDTTRELHDRRRFRIFGAALVILGAVMIWTLVLRYQDEQVRADRSILNEQQRRCSDILTADALVRVSIYATSRGANDPVAIARLRDRVTASHTDPSLLDDVRNDVEAILRTLPADTGGLREDAERANQRLLRVQKICYEGTPPNDPLAA